MYEWCRVRKARDITSAGSFGADVEHCFPGTWQLMSTPTADNAWFLGCYNPEGASNGCCPYAIHPTLRIATGQNLPVLDTLLIPPHCGVT